MDKIGICVHLEQIRPGEWDFSLANPGSCAYPSQSHQSAVDWEGGRSDVLKKNRGAVAKQGRTDAGQAKTEVQDLISPSCMHPFTAAHVTLHVLFTICVPFSAGNLARKGDLILHLISQSKCNSAWFIIHSHLWNPHFDQTQPEEGEGLSKPLPLWFSPPSLWIQPERREEEYFHHTSPSFLISESLTSKMEMPKCVIQFKNHMHSNRCCLLSTYYVPHFFLICDRGKIYQMRMCPAFCKYTKNNCIF